MPSYDTLWTGARLATMTPGATPYGAIEDAALAAKDGAIAWVGPRAELSAAPERLAARVVDAGGRWITPGLVDPFSSRQDLIPGPPIPSWQTKLVLTT